MNFKTMRTFLLILMLGFIFGCTSQYKTKHVNSQIVEDYFNVYSKRNDFEHFMSFYDDTAQLEDIIYGNRLKNKIEIREFLDWERGEFKVLSGNRILTITNQVLHQSTVVTEGFFHEFSYNGKKLGPWLFVIIQEFNENSKIIKQSDWINYTPRESFLGGINMNIQNINQ